MEEDNLSDLPSEESSTRKIRGFFKDFSRNEVKKKEWKLIFKFALYATLLFIIVGGPWTESFLTTVMGFGKYPAWGIRTALFFLSIMALYYVLK